MGIEEINKRVPPVSIAEGERRIDGITNRSDSLRVGGNDAFWSNLAKQYSEQGKWRRWMINYGYKEEEVLNKGGAQ